MVVGGIGGGGVDDGIVGADAVAAADVVVSGSDTQGDCCC